MSNSLQVFHFNSNAVRVQVDDQGNPWFCAKDICDILGYLNSRQSVSDHCNEAGVSKRYISYESGSKLTTFINEGNLYRLVIKSNKPEAEPFEAWVCDEVLPSIRKHGYYISPGAQPDLDEVTGNLPFQRLNTAKFDTLRKTSRSLAQAYLLECGITPDYVQQQIGQVGHNSAIYGEKTSNSLDALVDRFIEDWKSVGMVIAAPYVHCLSTQALRLFHAWASGKNIPLRMGDNHIIPALARHPDLYSKRVRISQGSTPRALLMIDGLKAPDDVDYTAWLGGCVAEMEVALKKLGAS